MVRLHSMRNARVNALDFLCSLFACGDKSIRLFVCLCVFVRARALLSEYGEAVVRNPVFARDNGRKFSIKAIAWFSTEKSIKFAKVRNILWAVKEL
jgi:hypothetical protein